MTSSETDPPGSTADALDDGTLLEALAVVEHERWAHWQAYVHDQGVKNPDGSITLPANLVERWSRQIATPYDQLTEDEKNSDREQVARYLPTIKDYLRRASS